VAPSYKIQDCVLQHRKVVDHYIVDDDDDDNGDVVNDKALKVVTCQRTNKCLVPPRAAVAVIGP